MNWTFKRTQEGSLSDLFIINLEPCWNQLSVSCREVVRCNQSSSLLHWKFSLDMGVKQWRIQGKGPGVWTPPFPPSDLTLVWDWNSYYGRIIYHFLTGWFLLMKQALHFATKLNSRDIQKCYCFWVPSYDLLASAPKQYFPHQQRLAFTNRETHGCLCFLSWSQKNSTVLPEPTFGPHPPQ